MIKNNKYPNKKLELVSKCRHENKFLLKNLVLTDLTKLFPNGISINIISFVISLIKHINEILSYTVL